MQYEIIEIEELSGSKATIYSIRLYNDNKTLFDYFVEKHLPELEEEINYIIDRLFDISVEFGAREIYFKRNEGELFDQIEALYDKPNSKLRLYCIRLGTSIVILGGGGFKPLHKRKLQEVPELKEANYFLRQVAKDIEQKVKNKEIKFSKDYLKLRGNLNFGE